MIFSICINFSFSQSQTNMYVVGDMTGWGSGQGALMTYRSMNPNNWIVTYLATSNNSGSVFKFANSNNGAYNQAPDRWSNNNLITFGIRNDFWTNTTDATLRLSATSGKYYTFIWKDVANSVNSEGTVMETSASPVSINSVNRTPTNPAHNLDVIITIVLSANKCSEEKFYVRYTTDSWATSSLSSEFSFAGTTGTATIPGQILGKTVIYYVFSTTVNNPSSNYDLVTLRYNNNSNSNYSYTVTNWITANNGNWGTASTWNANAIPSTTASMGTVTINHNVTLNQDANVGSITIAFGKTLISNAVTLKCNGNFDNQGTFTKGSGTVEFTGNGNLSGNATSFYNLTNSAGTRITSVNIDVEGTLLVSGGDFRSSGAKDLIMSGATSVIDITNGTITGTDAGFGNDISLKITGLQTTLQGNATTNSDHEKKFVNVTVNSSSKLILKRGILCRWGAFTMNGTLQIDANGYIQSGVTDFKIPIYGSNSILIYNENNSKTRGVEWTVNRQIQPGYPESVQIIGNTNFNVDNSNDVYCGGLSIESGSTFNLNSDNKDFIVKGNLNNAGTFNFGNTFGGDLYLTGSLTNTGFPINWGLNNGRAVFFNGTGDQNITGVTYIPFVIIENQANVILNNSLLINGNGTNFLTLNQDGKLNLNNSILSLNANGNIVINGTGLSTEKIITGNIGSRLVFTGGSGTITSLSSGTLKIDANVTVAVQGGAVNFGASITNLYGTLEIMGSANIATNNPVYHPGSTLKYVNNVNVDTGGEWPTLNGPTNLLIACTNNSKVLLKQNKTIGGTGTLTMQSGSLDLSTYSCTLSYTNGSTLKYDFGTSSEYTINNTQAQEWQVGTVPYNVNIASGKVIIGATRTATNDMTISLGATVEVAAGTGHLTVENLFNIGTITIKSPSNMTATGSLIVNNDITNTGTMIAERYVNANKWHYITPTNTNTSSSMFTNNSTGYYNNNFYTYNEGYNAVTDPVPSPPTAFYAQWTLAANGFKNAWVKAHNSNWNSAKLLDVPAAGYAYFNDISKTFEFNGTFINGDDIPVKVKIYYHDNDANDGYFDGWNLIANPFPASLDWDYASWDKSAIGNTVYYYDGGAAIPNYKYYNGTVPTIGNANDDESNSINGGSQKIPPMQAFFIKAKSSVGATGTDFIIPKAARVHDTHSFYKSTNTNPIQHIRLQVSTGSFTDETVIRFITDAINGFDDSYDAYKMYSPANNAPQIYSIESVSNFGVAINSLPAVVSEVPLGFAVTKTSGTASYTISATNILVDNYRVYLEDIQQNTTIDLREQNSYNFSLTSSETTKLYDIRERFKIKFIQNNAPVASGNLENINLGYGNSVNYQFENIFTDPDVALGDDITLSAKLSDGNEIPTWLNFNSTTRTFTGTPTQAGTYTINVIATDELNATTSVPFKITVEKAVLNIYTPNVSRYYGKINPEFEISYDGFLFSDNKNSLTSQPIAISVANQASNAGEYPIEIVNGISDNYNFNYNNGILTINKANLQVSVQNAERNYGTVNPVFEITYSGFELSDNPASLTLLPVAISVATEYSNTGIYTIEISGGEAQNYNFNYSNANLTVNPINLYVSVQNTERIYGQPNSDFTITYNGFVLQDNPNSLISLPTVNCNANQFSDAGIYPIEVSEGESQNYIFNYSNGNLTVNKANLFVSAENKTKNYGIENPEFTISFSGFVLDDDISDLDGIAPFATCNATSNSLAGDYNIILTISTDNNYNVNPQNGILTVNSIAPEIVSENVNNITLNSANFTGNLISHGGDNNTVKGICWSTEIYPTTENNYTELGTGIGIFSSIISNLNQNTTYYARAYATNNIATAYGEQITFNTLFTNINSLFSIAQIYPNPTSGIVNIKCEKNYEIELYSIDGKQINVEKYKTSNGIDINSLASGTYIIKLRIDNIEYNYQIELK